MVGSKNGLVVLLVALGTPAAPAAQAPEVLLSEGDTVIGLGALAGLGPVFAGDAGTWLAVVDTSFPVTSQDEAILRNGIVTLREGAALLEPAGATIDVFGSLALNDAGHLAQVLELSGPPASADAGVFWNARLVAREGAPLGAAGTHPAAAWLDFSAVGIDSGDALVVAGEIDDPTVGSNREPAIVRIAVDPSGRPRSIDVVAAEGRSLPGLQSPIGSLAIAQHAFAFNEQGRFIVIGKPTVAPAAILLDGATVLAQEGLPAPIPGRQYRALLTRSEVDLNDFGEYVFSAEAGDEGGAATSLFLMVKNGAQFVKEGDVLPALAPAAIGEGVAAPVILTNSGDVFWVAATQGGGAAFMRNHDAIVRAGDEIGGAVVGAVETRAGAFHASDDGRFWIGRVVVLGSGDALVSADFGLVVPLSGCAANAATLRRSAGHAIAGARMELELAHGQAPGVLPLVFVAGGRSGSAGCGVVTPFGELLVAPPSLVAVVIGPPWTGGGALIRADIPADPALVDASFYAQGCFWNPGPAIDGPRARLTNAVRIEIGAP